MTSNIPSENKIVITDTSCFILPFGENIRRLRQSKNLTQQALANIAEIELSQINRIETGKINPKLSTILIIAKALDVLPKELFNFYKD